MGNGKTPEPGEVVSLRVPKGLLKQFDRVAAQAMRPRANAIRCALREIVRHDGFEVDLKPGGDK